ncbi:hypothetical protein Droror1_Dr00016768 [Drosera rotundifolia]
MYSLKGGWAGQTFAFASRHDSDAKKTRIRRSKEERKTMVEAFIKRYQRQNEGNFPSISLTHRKVGGSFYTVREIIREIIQENRVLGPSRNSSVQKSVFDSVDLPPEAISSDPQSSLVHASGETLVDFPSSSIDDMPLEGDLQLSIGLRLENGQLVSGDHCEELGKMVSEEEQRHSGSLNHHGTVWTVSQNDLVHLEDRGDFISTSPINSSIEPPANGDTQSSIGLVLENGQLVNGNQKGELHESVSVVFSESGSSEADNESKSSDKYIPEFTNPIAEVEVETFPIRPVSSNGLLHPTLFRTGDGFGTDQAISSHETNIVESMDSINSSSNLVNQGGGDEPDVPILDGRPRVVNDRSMTDLVSDLLEASNKASIKGKETVTQDCTVPFVSVPQTELSLETIRQRQDATVKEPEGSRVNGVNNVNTATCNTSVMESAPKKAVLHGNRVDSRDDVDEKAPKETSPTLDRINLESWEGASKKPEANPLLALFKAFVTAFVKFWAE